MSVSFGAAPELSQRERELRRRHRKDFVYYASRALWIKPKTGDELRFRLNRAQLYIHTQIEEQLQRTGRVRKIIVKGRQQGCSTYVEGRFMWKVTHRKGRRAFILTHLDEATANLFDMAKLYYDRLPAPLKPAPGKANAKELTFGALNSGYKVSTAGSKGTGRSSTLQYFHGSEVAYWPNAEDHLAGALQAVPDAADTEIILESTAAGPKGVFAEKVQAALRGEGDFELIFVPWYWQEEYSRDVPEDWVSTSEELQYQRRYHVTTKQLVWRRAKIVELGGIHKFRHEYPATVHEALSAEVPGAIWTREIINENRWTRPRSELPAMRRIVVAVDPSGGDGPTNDEVGIAVAALDFKGHGYVLEDVSGKLSPNAWGIRAVAQYQRHAADRIVGEGNFGGKMVEHVVKTVDPKAAYKEVHASRGKVARAEPVAALYEQGLIHHVGSFIALEDEMATWVPGQPSPNRMDAVVWALTELLLEGKKHSLVKPHAT